MKATSLLTYFLLLLLISGLYQEAVIAQANRNISPQQSYVDGLEAFTSGDLERSRDLLLQAVEGLNNKAGVHYALADTYLALDDLPNAALYGKKAVELDPDNKWMRLKLAQIYRSAGQNQATLEELNSLIEMYPTDFNALYMLAETYKDYGEFVQSNNTLRKILRLTGPDIQTYLMKFRNFRSMGLADSALVQLEKIRETDPDNLEVLNLLGEFYSITGESTQAKSVLDDALERNARDPQSLINLAGIFLNEQKWDSAGILIRTFVSDTLNAPEDKMLISRYIYTQHTESPQNSEITNLASNVLDAFTSAEQNYGPAFTLAGQFYAQTGNTQKALQKLERANTLLPEDDIAWRQRLQLLLADNKLDEAISVGEEADNNVPSDAFIQFFTGSAWYLKGNYSKAEEWLKNASLAPARRPFKSAVYGTLADTYSAQEKVEDANQAYEMALRYDPENDNAMNNYAYHLAQNDLDLNKALDLITRALQVNNENAAYLDTMGWVYYKLEDYDQARRYVKAAIDTGEASAEVFEHMGDIYEKLDNINEAKKWWKEALDADSTRTHLKDKIN